MTDLIRDVLEYSQLSEKRTHFEEVGLGEIMSHLATEFDLMIEQKNATMHWESLPILLANQLQMQQMLGNLISNALKFSRNFVQPKIFVTSEPLTESDRSNFRNLLPDLNYCLIHLQDNGIGFD